MKTFSVGTRSVLFGVHAMFYHPLAVGLAWRKLYGRWPTHWEWLAIVMHDTGYVFCEDLDGLEGREHPRHSARWGRCVAEGLSKDPAHARYVEHLILGHSKSYAEMVGIPVSKLYAPDKLSVLYDPAWFYWLRGKLSGEIDEYWRREEERMNRRIPSAWRWLKDYRAAVRSKFLSSR